MIQQKSLFRQEAIEFQRQDRQWGKVTLLQPLSFEIIFWFITASVIFIIIFLSLAQYARKETVIGYLTPTVGVVRIFAPQQGIIKAIHIEEGQEVQEGQALLTVTTDQIGADGESVNTTILDTLINQKDLLTQQIESQRQLAASEQERLAAQIRGLETEISHIEVQIKTQSERVQLLESFVSSAARLKGKGYMSENEYKSRQEAYLDHEQNLSYLKQTLATRQNQLTEARYSLEQLPIVIAEKIQLLQNKFSEIEQRITEINSRRAYIIRAPTSGRISTLQTVVGGIADPQKLQLSIIPINNVLHAELLVPTRAIGFVRSGQRVRILYDAFPYQHFGTYGGQVIKVAQTILTNSDISAPVALREPVYKVTVALDRQDIDAYGAKLPLQVDMLLKADIILNRHSLIEWLLEPLTGIR